MDATRIHRHDRCRATRALGAALCLAASLGAKCGGGSGDGGSPPRIEVSNADARCLTLSSAFPAGFDLLPSGNGVVAQDTPPSVLGLDLRGSAPTLLARDPIPAIPADSDGDGQDDASASRAHFGRALTPLLGSVEALTNELVLASASNYEEVLSVDPGSGALRALRVETPAGERASDVPLLPAPGTSALRSAISTRRCVYPPSDLDSRGDPIGLEARCPGTSPSYFTRLTAGSEVISGRLFVATSNLRSSGLASFFPGTVLVFELDTQSDPPRVRPDPRTALLFTTGFNPTQVTAHTNALGRALALVTVTGAIGSGSGASNLRGESAVDVIDVESLRVVATIPLGVAGPSFDDLAIDPSGRIALLGSTSQRVLFAIDLRALDDPALFAGLTSASPAPPIRLDGTQPGFPDARIFDASTPLVLPDRGDGPPSATCDGFTHVAIGGLGDRAYASDFCDGSIATLELDLVGAPFPLPRERIRVLASEAVFAPNTPASLTRLRAPGIVRARVGRAGIDYPGPGVFALAGQPEGTVCGIALDRF
jgi:hypothetical protein